MNRFRSDARAIADAAIAGVSPAQLVPRAVHAPAIRQLLDDRAVHLLAVGKAAAPMAEVWLRSGPPVKRGLVIGPLQGRHSITSLTWRVGGHPIPNEQSVVAAHDALALARSVMPDESLIVLLSGGASALMALPLDGVSINDKQAAVSLLLKAGADIAALNTVRKHLSAIKGGRLAAVCRGRTVTLAISDVIDDDPTVIGSGPTVSDPTTYADAAGVIESLGVAERLPLSVRSIVDAGSRGHIEESVKPGDPRLARAEWRMIGGRREAMAAGREKAVALGYETITIDEPIVGESRESAQRYVNRLELLRRQKSGSLCVISSGETTVTVVGEGLGGRNQEFALAAALRLSSLPSGSAIASVGTDGIDGPTDAAGAIVDTDTLLRAADAGLRHPSTYLARNDSYHFFQALADLIVTGPTGTNVGDLQVAIIP